MASSVLKPPKAFVSYSWDDPAHREWVREFATRLRQDGVDVTLDHWHAVPGDQLPAFMESAIRSNDYVLIVCTPKYKAKSDARAGGVGYEGDIMTAEAFTQSNQRKFIPVLRTGIWSEAAPSWLLGKYYVDLRGTPYADPSYDNLLATLHGRRESPPPLGPPPPKLPGSPFWLAQAASAAEHMHRNHNEAHRGAVLWCPSVTAVFGNDGYDPEPGEEIDDAVLRARAEVASLQEKLTAAGYTQLAFGKSRDGYSWCILVDSPQVEGLDEMVWTCYPTGGSNNPTQRKIAYGRLWMLREIPVKDRCDA